MAYIRAKKGLAYEVAIMDMYSRKVLAFEVSNTMDEWFCVEVATRALSRYGKTQSDTHGQGETVCRQGGISTLFEDAGVSISMGERGFRDNILIERFWRSLKWECVFEG